MSEIFEKISGALEGRRERGLFREVRAVEYLSARECVIGGRKCIDFSSNNYLGISGRRELVEESVRWTEKYGTGSRASRLVSGTCPVYQHLEEKIAEWKATESALFLGSGFMANTGIIAALADRKTAIFADKLNHASLNDGCRLSGGDFRRYPHLDIGRLRKMLASSGVGSRLVVSDTVFSMDGDICDVPDISQTAVESGAMLYLDDAHATGVLGEKGRGLAHGGIADICMGTFSKAMGGYGAYAAGSAEIIQYLVNMCGSFIYSTAPPPAVFGAVSAAVDLVQTPEFDEKRRVLLEKSAELRGRLDASGFDTGHSKTPIIPLILGSEEAVLRISRNLLQDGIFAVAIRPPTVPKGTARIRISVNAEHTKSDFDNLVSSLEKHENP